MVFSSILNAATPDGKQIAYAVSGFCAVVASILLIQDLRNSARIQVSILFTIGGALLLYAHWHGASIRWVDAIARNTLLLTMLLSIGFLKLLFETESHKPALPKGRIAFRNTLLSLGFFGSVINLSAPIMICDRISEEEPIDQFTASAVTRIFCACSSWSPYFAGAALIMTSVKGVNLLQVMITGLPLLLVTIASVYWLALTYNRERVDRFVGYPVSVSKLWIPIALTLCVLGGEASFQTLPILVVISLSAILLSSIVITCRVGWQKSTTHLAGHVLNGFAKSSNELLLFLSAGVLATGLTALADSSHFQLNLPQFTLSSACITLAVMIVIAAAGLHPVIQISVLTPLLLPLQPDPELLAITYLFSWGLGTAASPLSGTHLAFQGRYGISAWNSALRNWRFVACMYIVAISLMGLHTTIF